jgi:hypothetical protein
VQSALDATKLKNPDEPIRFMAAVIRNGAEREAKLAKDQADAQALFDKRYPPRVLSEDEAKLLMQPEEFDRWKARKEREETIQ